MAKRLAEHIKRTYDPAEAKAEQPAESKAAGRTISVGVGLKESEVAELDAIAARIGFRRNAVMAWLLRRGLHDIRAGRLEIPVETEERRRLGEP